MLGILVVATLTIGFLIFLLARVLVFTRDPDLVVAGPRPPVSGEVLAASGVAARIGARPWLGR